MPSSSRYVAPSIRSAAVLMSLVSASTSYLPATKTAGTETPDRDTRPWREACSARCMYQSIGVVRNSRTARRTSVGRAVGNMKPLNRSTVVLTGPIGIRRATGVRTGAASLIARAVLTVIGRRSGRGMNRGAPMEAKVPPGTPATAKSPETRSGWRSASSKAVLTPIDQPATTQRSRSKASMTARASSTKASMPTRARVLGTGAAPDAAVVPRHDADAAGRVEQGRPGVGVGAQAVAQQHDRTVLDGVRPGLHDGAVAAGDLVEAHRAGTRAAVASGHRGWWRTAGRRSRFGAEVDEDMRRVCPNRLGSSVIGARDHASCQSVCADRLRVRLAAAGVSTAAPTSSGGPMRGTRRASQRRTCRSRKSSTCCRSCGAGRQVGGGDQRVAAGVELAVHRPPGDGAHERRAARPRGWREMRSLGGSWMVRRGGRTRHRGR